MSRIYQVDKPGRVNQAEGTTSAKEQGTLFPENYESLSMTRSQRFQERWGWKLDRGLALGDLSAEYGSLDFIQSTVGSPCRNMSRREPRWVMCFSGSLWQHWGSSGAHLPSPASSQCHQPLRDVRKQSFHSPPLTPTLGRRCCWDSKVNAPQMNQGKSISNGSVHVWDNSDAVSRSVIGVLASQSQWQKGTSVDREKTASQNQPFSELERTLKASWPSPLWRRTLPHTLPYLAPMTGCSASSLLKVLHHRLIIGSGLLLQSIAACRGDKMPTETLDLCLLQPEHNSGVICTEWKGHHLLHSQIQISISVA